MLPSWEPTEARSSMPRAQLRPFDGGTDLDNVRAGIFLLSSQSSGTLKPQPQPPPSRRATPRSREHLARQTSAGATIFATAGEERAFREKRVRSEWKAAQMRRMKQSEAVHAAASGSFNVLQPVMSLSTRPSTVWASASAVLDPAIGHGMAVSQDRMGPCLSGLCNGCLLPTVPHPPVPTFVCPVPQKKQKLVKC